MKCLSYIPKLLWCTLYVGILYRSTVDRQAVHHVIANILPVLRMDTLDRCAVIGWYERHVELLIIILSLAFCGHNCSHMRFYSTSHI